MNCKSFNCTSIDGNCYHFKQSFYNLLNSYTSYDVSFHSYDPIKSYCEFTFYKNDCDDKPIEIIPKEVNKRIKLEQKREAFNQKFK